MKRRNIRRRSGHRSRLWGMALASLALAAGWLAIGSDVRADLAFDQLGDDLQGGPFVALSESGNRLAVGSPGRDLSSDVGVVRVYEWTGIGWSQLGADLVGEDPGDRFGWAVELSSDGNRVAAGAWRNQGSSDVAGLEGGQVRVFEWNGSSWTQLGDGIDGDADSYYSGNDVELSVDGNRVAVAGWTQVRMFDWDGSNWVQAGSYLPGGERGIAMSADGRRVLTATLGEAPVLVHDWNGSDWIPAGTPLAGEGGCTTMSADGNRVTYCYGDELNVETFDWGGSDWVRVGDEVRGYVWAMSDDGNRLVSIDPVQVFDWDGSTWSEPTLLPEGDRVAALSADGSIIAVGIDSTIVRVYRVSQAPSTTTTSTTEVSPTSTVTPGVTSTPAPVASLPPTGPSPGSRDIALIAIVTIAMGTVALTISRHGDDSPQDH